MPAHRRALAVVALLALALPRCAYAAAPIDPTGARAIELVHGFWNLVSKVSTPTGPD